MTTTEYQGYPSWNAWPQTKRTARIVRDPRNAEKDYFIPEKRAEELYTAGLLALCELRSEGWNYLAPRGEYIA
jgi:hypothetical protein